MRTHHGTSKISPFHWIPHNERSASSVIREGPGHGLCMSQTQVTVVVEIL